MQTQKRVAAIHDISGFGKCSLTVALPILSAAGVETSVIPTAVLSTHTSGFKKYTFRDLTSDLLPFAQHWKSIGINFDALYSGYLGSYEQLSIVSGIFDMFKTDGNIILVDPVMGDNGRLYSAFNEKYTVGMKKFCSKADIILPNITEASILLGVSYREGPYEREYIEKMLKGLSALGPNRVAITGVSFDNEKTGAASYDKITGKFNYAFSRRVEGNFHGTGDVFASALLAGIMNGFSFDKAAQLAVDFTQGSILRTSKARTNTLYGVNFEAGLPQFIKNLGLM